MQHTPPKVPGDLVTVTRPLASRATALVLRVPSRGRICVLMDGRVEWVRQRRVRLVTTYLQRPQLRPVLVQPGVDSVGVVQGDEQVGEGAQVVAVEHVEQPD